MSDQPWSDRKYVVLPTDNITQDMLDVSTDSCVDDARKNLAGDEAVLEYDYVEQGGDPPVFDPYTKRTYTEMLTYLLDNSSTWEPDL